MAKRKAKRARPQGFPSWYVAGGDPAKRYRAVARWRADIATARKFLYGFEAKDGYDARQPWKIPASKLRKLQRVTRTLQSQLRQPHIEKAVPRTAKRARRALSDFARQAKPASQVRKFIVPLVDPNFQTVRATRGRLVFGRDVPGAKLQYTYFVKPKNARTFDDIIAWIEKNYRRWPKGQYQVIMSQHGLVSDSAHRDGLVGLMNRWHTQYDNVQGKEETPDALIGFLWMGDDIDRRDALKAARRSAMDEMSAKLEKARRTRNKKLAADMKRRGILK